jgi:hypothetical protein
VAVWAVVVTAASVFPDDPQISRVALMVHLVYGLQWLFGRRTLGELVSLASSAHPVIAVGLAGLMASGIALCPDLDTTLARIKMVLVLIVMLNGLLAQRILHRMRDNHPAETSGANIPWDSFQRALAVALVSQSTWWGSIAIGFITNANRHS